MDTFVQQCLSDWGFAHLIEIFRDQLIDKEAFLLLNDDLLKELIPQIGIRAKFSQKLKDYKSLSDSVGSDTLVLTLTDTNELQDITNKITSVSSPIDTSNSSSTITVTNSPSPSLATNEDAAYYNRQHYPALGNVGFPVDSKSVIDLLGNEERGREIADSYKNLKKFSRSNLATLIIEKELKGNPDHRVSRN